MSREAKRLFSAEGVEELESRARLWTSEQYVKWLRLGFDRHERLLQTGEEHWAFWPLRFHRDGSVLGQLTALFAVLEDRHPRLHNHARRAVEDQLRLWIGARFDDEEMHFAANLWRVYGAMGATGETVAIARLSIRAIDDPPVCAESIAELIDAITLAVAAGPVNGSQISFFEFLDSTQHWHFSFTRLLAPRYFEWHGGSPERAWRELLLLYGDSLRDAMNPLEPAGRAFIALVANRLNRGRQQDRKLALDVAASRRLFALLDLEFDGDSAPKQAAEATSANGTQIHAPARPKPGLNHYRKWPQSRQPAECAALRQMQVAQ